MPWRALGIRVPWGFPGVQLPRDVPRDWVPWGTPGHPDAPEDWVPWGILGTRCPGVSLGTSGQAVVAQRTLTIVELVVGLLLAAVGWDAVDLHPHEGVHDGAPLLPVQLGQLLRRDHLGAEGAGGWRHRAPWGGGPQEKGCGWHLAGSGDGVGRREK